MNVSGQSDGKSKHSCAWEQGPPDPGGTVVAENGRLQGLMHRCSRPLMGHFSVQPTMADYIDRARM